MKGRMFMLLTIMLVTANVAFGAADGKGDQEREIHALVSRLSWESTIVVCNGLMLQIYPKGESAKRLIEIGEPATYALLSALGDEEKALAAHIILTAIWERPLITYVKSEPLYERRFFWKREAGYLNTFNDLKWKSHKDRQRIGGAVLAENVSRWRRKVIEYELRRDILKAAPNNGMHPTRDTRAVKFLQ